MKLHLAPIIICVTLCSLAMACRSTRKIATATTNRDTASSALSHADTVLLAQGALKLVNEKKIDFQTFSAKIKMDYEDSKGKQPDFIVFIRLRKDSALWASINATFLGIEAFRILATTDSIFIVNKLAKEYEVHPLQYLSDLTHIPMDFTIMQDLLIGNPVFVGDSIVSYSETSSHLLVETVGNIFKNMITISKSDNKLNHCKLDDTQPGSKRTADISYSEYEMIGDISFAGRREIVISENSKVEIGMSFKQPEFNKELSFRFIIPPNYKIK